MNYSEIKKLKAFCDDLFSQPNYREVLENIVSDNGDFEVDSVRFIDSNYIDEIQQEELSNDLYCLGCFNANFLSDVLGIDQDVIDALHEAEAYEALGKLIISMGKLEELQSRYASADGYGHHFNHYNFGEGELQLASSTLYHVFDNR